MDQELSPIEKELKEKIDLANQAYEEMLNNETEEQKEARVKKIKEAEEALENVEHPSGGENR